MNLEDKLKELKGEVPKMDSSLEQKIYAKSKQKNSGRNPIFNKLTFSICGIALVVLLIIIIPFSINRPKTEPGFSAIQLLHQVDEPTEYISPDATQKQFYEELGLFSGKLAKECLDDLEPTENAVMSPASIFSALALVVECTDGDTRKQILDAFGMEYELLEKNYPRFYQSLNMNENNSKQIKSRLSNSIWLKQDYTYKDDCISSLASKYYCYSHGVDYSEIEYVNKYVSDFIAKQTNNFLKPNIKLDPDTVFFLLNTLYIKDAWNDVGKDLSFTDMEYKFNNASNQVISRKFLQGAYKQGRAIYNEEYKQFYTETNQYTLTFIVPQNGNKIEEVFTPEVISNVRKTPYVYSTDATDEEAREYYFTRCLFPEFSVSSTLSLENTLNSLGIKDMFTLDSNFNNISDESLVCSMAMHYARLEVNKKGIEGAAATIIDIAPGSAEPVKEIHEDFIVDESFGFVITDFRGTNLFSGIIRTI